MYVQMFRAMYIPGETPTGCCRHPRGTTRVSTNGKDGKQETVIPKMSQETLAEMTGTTRSRVSFFMNRFRKLGFIEYDGGSGLQVHSSLLNVVLQD
jgi:CRP/FNR family transcriptional regulator, cyclic AMP receptor protein